MVISLSIHLARTQNRARGAQHEVTMLSCCRLCCVEASYVRIGAAELLYVQKVRRSAALLLL